MSLLDSNHGMELGPTVHKFAMMMQGAGAGPKCFLGRCWRPKAIPSVPILRAGQPQDEREQPHALVISITALRNMLDFKRSASELFCLFQLCRLPEYNRTDLPCIEKWDTSL